jgi:hypothetical protein
MANNPTTATNHFSQTYGFTYIIGNTLTANFQQLSARLNWSAKTRARHWFRCQKALMGSIYGTNTSSLAAWQCLCTDVNIWPLPSSITQCKKVSTLHSVQS